MLKGIIFDMDGVLVKTIHLAEQVAREKFESKNIHLTETDIEHLAGYTWKEFLEYVYKTHDIAPVDGLYESIIETYSKRLPDNVILYDQAIEILDKLHGKYLLALASGSCRKDIEYNLEKFGLRKYFKAVVSCDDVKKGKPAPDIYIKALKEFKLNYDQCIVIEDTAIGLKAAKTAGLRCIGITHTQNRKKLHEAHHIIDHLNEIHIIVTKYRDEP